MSNTDLIIEERSRDIGDFLIGRLIPFRKKRMVGPFIFIDHMGPAKIGPGHYMDVDQHPHIGLSTLTYLLEGEMQHQDSIGTNQRITPGSVNWMTAGAYVTHTERTPVDLRDGGTYPIHGYQIWVALPKHLEDMEPGFHHLDPGQLPSWKEQNASFKLIAGKGFGQESPLPVYSELFMVEVQTEDAFELKITDQLSGEIGICIVEGAINACDQHVEKGNMLVSKVENQCAITIHQGSRILLFGGAPFEEERHIFWNFVSSDPKKIAKATEQWKSRDFPTVAGDDTYVPLPEVGAHAKRK